MLSLIVLILSACALFSLVLELDVFQPKAKS
jgi:hypothetical protein